MDQQKTMDAALRFLTAKARTQSEVKRHLANKGADDETIDAVMLKLREYGYVDDEHYVRRFGEDKAGKLSAGAIRRKLMQRGIDKQSLTAITGDGDLAAALSYASRALPKITDADDRKRRQKLTARLLSRGFGYDTASEVWRRLTGDAGEDGGDGGGDSPFPE